MSLNYIGVDITRDGNLNNEVKAQTMKATRVSTYLRDFIWKNRSMSSECKTRIYKTAGGPRPGQTEQKPMQ